MAHLTFIHLVERHEREVTHKAMKENIGSQLVSVEKQIASYVGHALYVPNIRTSHGKALEDILKL